MNIGAKDPIAAKFDAVVDDSLAVEAIAASKKK